MSRIRMLKPDTFLDEDLAKVSHAARWLFAALWTLADREGRLEDRPHKIRALTFPYEPQIDIEALLGELSRTKENGGTFLTRYEAEGCKVIQLTNFAKHQKPHIREAMSVLPKPCPEKPGKGTPKANLAGTRPPVPVSVPDTVPVRTEQPVQPPSSPSVDSRTDADAARADVLDALADWRKRHPEHVNVGMNDFHLLASVPEFFAPTGPVRPDSSNVNLLRATAAKIRGHGRPKPRKGRKVTAPAWDQGLEPTTSDAEVTSWDPRLGPRPETLGPPTPATGSGGEGDSKPVLAPSPEALKSPVSRPSISLTVAPGACPECDSPLRYSTEGGETVLRCDQETVPCEWAAVWRSVAA